MPDIKRGNILAKILDYFLTEKLKLPKDNIWFIGLRRFFNNPKALFGTLFLLLIITTAFLANFIAPFDPNEQILEISSKGLFYNAEVISKKNNNMIKIIPIKSLIRESDEKIEVIDFMDKKRIFYKTELLETNDGKYTKVITYFLGTDRFGRDILSRLIFGSRISLSVGLISQSISVIIGIILGSLAGYFRGFYDKTIMWIVNVVWAFPSILFVIALSLVLGKGYWQAFVAIGLTSWVEIARVMRGQVITIMETEYIESAKSSGFGALRIIVKHILPNCTAPLLVTATVGLANAVIFEASLSFLGLGVQPPTPSWGQMVFDGYKYLVTGSNYGMVLVPSFAIFLTVYSINLIGDGLRDAFDPKLKK